MYLQIAPGVRRLFFFSSKPLTIRERSMKMTTRKRCLCRSLEYIIFVLIFVSAFSKASYAQDIFPHQLSEAVQTRAKELHIWEQVNEEFGGRIYIYLEELTAADIMAQTRAEYQGKKAADNSDYDMMFASWCRFIPNKPPLQNYEAISKTIRMKLALSGLYLDHSKRLSLTKTMQSVLLKGDINNLYNFLSKVRTIDEFNNKVFDSSVLGR
jgi:hypothetical protein